MIRRYSRVLAVVTTCMALTIMAGCGGGDSPTKPTTPTPTPPPTPVATTITVTPSSHTLEAISATVQLSATVKDQNNNTMTGQTVTWSSGNTAVATVNAQGLVTAVSNGSAQITARSGNASGTASITVSEPMATRITITPSSRTLEAIGETVQLMATVRDQRNNVMTGQTVTWSSGDDAVATVSEEGLVTAVTNGMVDITAQSGSLSSTATISVSEPVPTTIVIDPTSAALESIGETVQLTAVVLDQRENTMPDAMVTWSSGDEALATVEEAGLVTAVDNGMVDITAQSDEAMESVTITVSQVAAIITITPEMTTLTEFGETVQLEVFAEDANEVAIDEPSIAWTSSDETVATVDEGGLVKAVGNGMADITAQSGNAMQSVLVTVAGPSADRETLIAIYNATDGMNWTMQDNWVSEERVSMWDGVATDDRGRVTELNLAGFGLMGPIPMELGQLDHLVMLDLSGNSLSGMIPMELGQFANLAALHLQNNADLEGPLPDSFLDLALLSLNLGSTQVCVPRNADFQMWLSGIMDAQGITLCEITYLPWTGLMVSPGKITFVTDALPIPIVFENTCSFTLNNLEIMGASITVHEAKWQRRTDMDSPWMDLEDTIVTFQVCPLSPDEPGDYRLVGDATINGERGLYASENYFTIE